MFVQFIEILKYYCTQLIPSYLFIICFLNIILILYICAFDFVTFLLITSHNCSIFQQEYGINIILLNWVELNWIELDCYRKMGNCFLFSQSTNSWIQSYIMVFGPDNFFFFFKATSPADLWIFTLYMLCWLQFPREINNLK